MAGATVSGEALDDPVLAPGAEPADTRPLQAGAVQAGAAEAGNGNGRAGHAPVPEVLDPQEAQGGPSRG